MRILGDCHCERCGKKVRIFMLVNQVWLTLFDKRAFMCLACTRERMLEVMGRDVKLQDLKDVPCNDWLFGVMQQVWARTGKYREMTRERVLST